MWKTQNNPLSKSLAVAYIFHLKKLQKGSTTIRHNEEKMFIVCWWGKKERRKLLS